MYSVARATRLPAVALAAGSATGLALYAGMPAFGGYVAGVMGVVGDATPGGPPGVAVSLAGAFLVGASMNFLPCNLPVVMTLLPSTTREESRGAFLEKTALYGVGAVSVLGTLGALLGLLGQRLAPLVFAYPSVGASVAAAVVGGTGLLSVLWGLQEFGLLSLPGLPVSMTDALRGAADDREGATGYLLLGAVYGGTGGGCPMPTYHLLLVWVVVAASPAYGAAVLGTYVLGRVLPVAVLGAALREHPGRAAGVFGGKHGTLQTVNGVVLVGVGSLLVVFTGVRLLAGGG